MMLNEYFVQFGLIIFPITGLQIWTFGKSFNHLPLKTWTMGIYGGVVAILCQVMPVHIFGQLENFQCVPIILSILYGKRKAGLLSMGMLAAYQIIALQPHSWIPSIIAILVYSAIPMVICGRFERYVRIKRFWTAILLAVVTLVVELLFLLVYFSVVFGKDGFLIFSTYFNFLGVACLIQLTMMAIAFLLLENIIENGRIRNRHASLIAFNPVGIVAFDMNNCFIAVNSAYEAITGYKEAELLGRSRLHLWFEDEYDFAEEFLDHTLHGEIKKDLEVDLRHKDGHRITVRSTVVPIVDGESVFGFFAMVTDITESKLAEEVLRNSEKLTAIGQLAAGVAHEIRNPLTSIKGFLQIMASSSSPGQSRYFDIMKSELNRIEGIVSEMLLLAKPQTVSFREVNVREKLEEVVYLIEGEANMQNVEIAIDFDSAGPILMGDENQLKQVFLNLAKNAIEAMPSGGKLKISLRQQDDTVIANFADDGDGIPEEMLEKIGEPFYSTKTKGTGLGFLVSKRIITNHNGSMSIRSASGKGTTVSVTLPIHRADIPLDLREAYEPLRDIDPELGPC